MPVGGEYDPARIATRDKECVVTAKFVSCGPNLTVNVAEVASLSWDKADTWRGGDSYLIVTLNSGIQHRVKHQAYGYDAVDCYKIERAIVDA